ncbi:LLM class flavin-dependent oxidoreductase [Tessaracoccus sp. OS52]|uniref:LLM class flavin-dependent oxidoreductase n=1 Tax=Tessaracoccus sp. OS52 TaxID=2886691 RepID=UPI001D1048A6|nr:LLM class flavin-dependent oxidoreductase [Tessaracoccus sp. OS52]MCC2592979.1 LLM class flavin-dependent oxidoreductase [Tessaracoccus sp. OS52]
MTRVPLSVLDLVSVSSDQTPAQAIDAAMEAAQLVDRLGYERLWYAEHHNTASVASSATSLLVGRAAGLTERIRVGSGGVMLPNHAPLMVAENYGTLAQMFPGRIDLGLGRAPGTDQLTARALARSSAAPDDFVANVVDLMNWFDGGRDRLGIHVGVAEGTRVPIWMLGSSTAGATMAAALGLPYSFASHFAPDALFQALEVYRSNFDAEASTAQIDKPYVSVGINVMACEDEAEAHHQFTVTQNMFLAMQRTGGRTKLQPPGEPGFEVTEMARMMADKMLQVSAVGTPEQVAEVMQSVVEQTGADELITVTYAHDPAVRLRSLELTAQAWGLTG